MRTKDMGENASAIGLLSVSLPRGSDVTNAVALFHFCQVLDTVSAQRGAQSHERSTNSGGQDLHAGGCTKSNQGNDQNIFDHILPVVECNKAAQAMEKHRE